MLLSKFKISFQILKALSEYLNFTTKIMRTIVEDEFERKKVCLFKEVKKVENKIDLLTPQDLRYCLRLQTRAAE